jgi:hypothetical protein
LLIHTHTDTGGGDMNSTQIFLKTHTFGDAAYCSLAALKRVLSYAWHNSHAARVKWIALGFFSFMCGANAMTVQRVGSDVFVSGVIERHDDRLLRAEFERGEVKRLILVNSPGGDLPAGMAMARWLQGQGVTTLVVGQCLSACSLLFMAGLERQYATGLAPTSRWSESTAPACLSPERWFQNAPAKCGTFTKSGWATNSMPSC